MRIGGAKGDEFHRHGKMEIFERGSRRYNVGAENKQTAAEFGGKISICGQSRQPDGSVKESDEEASVEDVAEISLRRYEREKTAKNGLEELRARYEQLKMELEKAREQSDAMAGSMEVRLKCMLIARRIMSGDKVPEEDYRYLAKNDLELYAKAVSMRIEKKDPEEYDRVSEEEEEDSGGASGEPPKSIGEAQSDSGAAEGAEAPQQPDASATAT